MTNLVPALLYLLTALGPTPQASDVSTKNLNLSRALGAVPGDHRDTEVVLPRLKWVDAGRAEQAWLTLKSMSSPASQALAIRRGGIEQFVCKGLVDFRDIAKRYGAGLDFRDQFRGRSWARPAMARVLLRASERFAEEYPSARLTLGDIAQPGCGQVAYGTLIRHVVDAPGLPDARNLLANVRRVLGEPLEIKLARSTDFPLEADRFDGDVPVLIEQKVLGISGGVRDPDLVRVAVRRFIPEPLPMKPRTARREVAKMLRDAEKLMRSGELVRHEATRTFDPQTADDVPAFVQHRLDRKRGLQLVVISSKVQAGSLDLASVVELRVARWRPGKPESFGAETRWQPVHGPDQDVVGWDRWHMLREAGHISHLAGRDVDISYVTHKNIGLQKVRMRAIDAEATWRWFQIVSETALSYGTPVEQILVGPKTRGWLRRHLSPAARESTLWRDVVHCMAGHDAHHHLRLAPPTAADDAQALAELRGDPVATARR